MTLNLNICFPNCCHSYKGNLSKTLFFALLKLIVNFFSAAPTLSLISSVVPSPNSKKLFLQLSV